MVVPAAQPLHGLFAQPSLQTVQQMGQGLTRNGRVLAARLQPGGHGQGLLQVLGFWAFAGLQHQAQRHDRRHQGLTVQALAPQPLQRIGLLLGCGQLQAVHRVGQGLVATGLMQQVQGHGTGQASLGHQPPLQGLQKLLQRRDELLEFGDALRQVQALIEGGWRRPEGPRVRGLAIGGVQQAHRVGAQAALQAGTGQGPPLPQGVHAQALQQTSGGRRCIPSLQDQRHRQGIQGGAQGLEVAALGHTQAQGVGKAAMPRLRLPRPPHSRQEPGRFRERTCSQVMTHFELVDHPLQLPPQTKGAPKQAQAGLDFDQEPIGPQMKVRAEAQRGHGDHAQGLGLLLRAAGEHLQSRPPHLGRRQAHAQVYARLRSRRAHTDDVSAFFHRIGQGCAQRLKRPLGQVQGDPPHDVAKVERRVRWEPATGAGVPRGADPPDGPTVGPGA